MDSTRLLPKPDSSDAGRRMAHCRASAVRVPVMFDAPQAAQMEFYTGYLERMRPERVGWRWG